MKTGSQRSVHLPTALGFVISIINSSAQYTAYDLGPGSANHINSSGTVVGYTYVGGVQVAFQYSAGHMTTLTGLPGADFSIAYCINDRGDISGTSGGDYIPGRLEGFLYRSGVSTPVPALGSYTYASAMNQSGVIVGESTPANTTTSHAFRYSNGVTTDLGTFGGPYSRAASINSSGVIVGSADLPNSPTRAFRYENGTMTDLGALDGRGSSAYDINDLGTIVGESTVGGPSSGYIHAFQYQGGVMIDLGTLAPGFSASSEAYAINSLGLIIGTSDARAGTAWTRHAFLYKAGVMTDLAPCLATVGLTGLSIAEDINDTGDIVGYANDAGGNMHGFLLLVPEPSSTSLIALGTIAWALRRRH